MDTTSRWVTLNSPLYGKGAAPEGTVPWDVLVLSHIAPARRSWPFGVLEWPVVDKAVDLLGDGVCEDQALSSRM